MSLQQVSARPCRGIGTSKRVDGVPVCRNGVRAAQLVVLGIPHLHLPLLRALAPAPHTVRHLAADKEPVAGAQQRPGGIEAGWARTHA